VWGHEECGLVVTETIATHDLRTRDTTDDAGEGDAGGPGSEEPGREDTNSMNDPDADMDQLRIPEASAFVEIFNARPVAPASHPNHRAPDPNDTLNNSRRDQTTTHYPVELYGLLRDHDGNPNTPKQILNETRHLLDLGRVVGDGADQSPVFRLVVGRPADFSSPHLNTPRFLADAARVASNTNDPFNAAPPADVTTAVQEYQHTVDFEVGGGGLLGFEANTPANNRVIDIDRVVWFANLAPVYNNGGNRTALNVLTNEGLTPEQIYYNRSSAPPALEPGQYAVVGPREETLLGMKTTCTDANLYEYDPSDQRFSFQQLGTGWTFKYFNMGGVENDPVYHAEDATNYFVRDIVPVIAQANPPHENVVGGLPLGPLAQDWQTYVSSLNNNANQIRSQVDFGFNISAPLPNANYYPAPLSNAKLNSQAGPNGTYPKFDAYFDAENGTGAPRDTPVDDVPNSGKPLSDRNWLQGGTHQDASTIFLQKLADPTRPFSPGDNPYITVSTLSMDLHVFSGHQDLADEVDVDGAGTMQGVDRHTAAGTFDSNMEYDTRRSIPDTSRDRAHHATTNPNAIIKHRSPFTYRQNILQGATAAGAGTFFRYQLRSGVGGAGYADQLGADLDASATAYPQTFGYLNREWGAPREFTNQNPATTDFYVGLPENTVFVPLPWYDRDFASPYEIAMVPACSTARFGIELDLGTDADFSTLDPVEFENRRPFGHLLGFDHNYDSSLQRTYVRGPSPGFDMIFDFVDTGAIYADGERWISPLQTQQSGFATYNRVTETLRPPFNNITLHRVPGKINLNTTPDYLQNNDANDRTNFDLGESAIEPESTNSNSGTARNFSRFKSHDGGTLNGNIPKFSGYGGVYKALSYGFSTIHELNTGEFAAFPASSTDHVQNNRFGVGIPRVGQSIVAGYPSTQDTPFGYNFKGFIESRTGFSQAYAATPGIWDLRNRFVDHRFPTRFAGVFGTASTANLPTLRQYAIKDKDFNGTPDSIRRTYDVSLLRPHPDLDRRTRITDPNQDQFDLPTDQLGNTVLRSSMISTPLFERPEPELHLDGRHYDHVPAFRWRNTAKLANMTTTHSNVYMLRMTIGYFVVDPQTGEVGAEYGVSTNQNKRDRAMYLIDRSIPAPYEKGQPHDAFPTVLLENVEQ
ncbi:MAG: hypothetical protein WBD31_04450, partial [Rubripirellula sp.]